MNVTVNGTPTDVGEDETVATLVAARAGGHDRAAAARNGDGVPRSSWADTRLTPGDRVEVLAPTAGG